ncbi:MAG: 50S ribosomal protein L10, partial [Candidatus Saccharimonadales bacterium]
NQVVAEVGELLGASKLTVVTTYQGTTVQNLQRLRSSAKENGTTFRVVKNRLVKQALLQTENLKEVDSSVLTGMLLYGFNAEDEAAPAQAIASFAKQSPTLEFVGAITADGQFMSAEDVKALASLPGKEQLRGMLVGTLAAPLSGFVNVIAGNVRCVLNVLNARAEALS